MQLKITQKDRSLLVELNNKVTFDLRFQENLWNNSWKVRHGTGREFALIKKKVVPFFSSDAVVKITHTENSNEPVTLLLKYVDKKPHAVFEYNGSRIQIIFHPNNRFSYFQDDKQIGLTELNTHIFEGYSYVSSFNEQIIESKIFLLSQLSLIYLNSVADSDIGGFRVITFRSFFYGELRPFDEGWG